jgi:hypothetical protein
MTLILAETYEASNSPLRIILAVAPAPCAVHSLLTQVLVHLEASFWTL